MLYEKGRRKMCTCLLPDPPITYFSQLLRCLILWVKTKKVTLVCEKFYQVTCRFSDCPRLRISSVDAISGQIHFWPWALSVFWLWNHQRRQTPPASLSCLGHSLSGYLGRLQRAPPSPSYSNVSLCPHGARWFCLGTCGPYGLPWPDRPEKPGLSCGGLRVGTAIAILWAPCCSLWVSSASLAISLLLKTK